MKETYNWILAIRERDESGRYKPTTFNYYDNRTFSAMKLILREYQRKLGVNNVRIFKQLNF